MVDPTAAAVRTAVESHREEGLAAQLMAAVDGIAEIDPGVEADINGPVIDIPKPPVGGSEPDVVGDSVKIGVYVIAAAIALPFLIGALALMLALRRRRVAVHDREEIDEGDARDELVALGEELQALDLDVDMPNASPRGRDEYRRALDLYDRANRLLLKHDLSEVELYEARRSIEEGRKRLPPPPRRPRGAWPPAAGPRRRRAVGRDGPSFSGCRGCANACRREATAPWNAPLLVADREGEEELGLDLDAALPAASALEGRDDDVIAGVRDDPLDLDLEVVPLVRPDAERLQYAGVSVLLRRHARGDDGRGLCDHDVLAAQGEDRIGVAPRVGVERASDELDVAFGHTGRLGRGRGGVLEVVVAPEELVADRDGRDAGDAALERLGGVRA